MDLRKEPSNNEYEQITAGGAPRVKTSTKKHQDYVFVLSEMEKVERVGRFCRMLKYHLKLIDRPNTDLKVENVSKGKSDAKPGCKIHAVEHTSRAKLKLHVEEHQLHRHGSRFSNRLSENKKNLSGERKVTFSTRSDLNPQLAKCKRQIPQSKKYMCNLCGTEQSHLKRHMMIHTGETPHTCKICAKAFSRSDWLAKHMNVHRDKKQACADRKKKQYSCDHCEKKYTRKDSLLNHSRTHTDHRPSFLCAICEKRFYDKKNLMTHLMCHSDDRPFICSQCGHGFKRLGTLNKHKRIHTGEKPYSCSNCGKRFPYKYSLSMHSKKCFI